MTTKEKSKYKFKTFKDSRLPYCIVGETYYWLQDVKTGSDRHGHTCWEYELWERPAHDLDKKDFSSVADLLHFFYSDWTLTGTAAAQEWEALRVLKDYSSTHWAMSGEIRARGGLWVWDAAKKTARRPAYQFEKRIFTCMPLKDALIEAEQYLERKYGKTEQQNLF